MNIREGTFKCRRAFLVPSCLRRHTKTCSGDEVAIENAERVGWTTGEPEGLEGEVGEAGEDTIVDHSYDFVGIYLFGSVFGYSNRG